MFVWVCMCEGEYKLVKGSEWKMSCTACHMVKPLTDFPEQHLLFHWLGPCYRCSTVCPKHASVHELTPSSASHVWRKKVSVWAETLLIYVCQQADLHLNTYYGPKKLQSVQLAVKWPKIAWGSSLGFLCSRLVGGLWRDKYQPPPPPLSPVGQHSTASLCLYMHPSKWRHMEK